MSEYIITDKQLGLIQDFANVCVEGEKLPRIVRCRDCKHFTPKGTHKFENGKVNVDSCVYVRGYVVQINPDGFCAWGERRES